jgi:GT2 family glycosyltransferase
MDDRQTLLEQAKGYADKQLFDQALSILHRLMQDRSPVRGAHLLFAKLFNHYTFKYLGLEAARREHELFGCREAGELTGVIANSLTSHQQLVPQLPLISFIVVARAGEESDWHRCIESLSLQMNRNIELCLISETPASNWPVLPSFVTVYPPTSAPIHQKVEIARAVNLVRGAVVSVIERPRTVFCFLGTTFAALALHADSAIEILQSATVYQDGTCIFENTRPSAVQWSQALILDPITLEPPSTVFNWRGVFFKRQTLLELLPFDTEIDDALAMDLAARFLRTRLTHTIKTPVILDDAPIMARSFHPTLRELADARLIIRREQAFITGAPSAAHTALIEPLPQASLARELPRVLPTILISGRVAAPTISIVTPVLNCREYLAQCFDSILSQNYPHLEYIVLDGGSTDGTLEIIKKYERHLSFWRSAPDGGQYAAINDGLQRTSGSIMSWLNADDCLAPYTLDLVAALFNSQAEIEWLTGSYCFLDSGPSLVLTGTPTLSGETYFDDGFDRPFVQQEGTFWKRSLWDRTGAALDLRLDMAADMELWTRFFQHAHPYVASVPLAIFRRHSGQRSQVYLNRYMNEAYRVIERLKSCGAKPFIHPRPEATRLVIPLIHDQPRH